VASLLQDFGPKAATGAPWAGATTRCRRCWRNWPPPPCTDSGRAAARAHPVLQEQLPVIPVVWYRQTCAVSRRLRGASIDPFERSYRISSLQWT
jgi:peptide/nickel transport system substrate-binding protein